MQKTTFVLSLFLLLGLFGSSPASADTGQTPAHYIVMQLDADSGQIVAESYAAVSLRGGMASISAEQQRMTQFGLVSRNHHQFATSLVDASGEVVWRGVTKVPRWVRAEFAGENGQIDGQTFADPAPWFVVRVPILPETDLRLTQAGRASVQFNLDQLIQTTPHIRNATRSADDIAVTGDAANRVDMLIMGDGFGTGQEETFDAVSQSISNNFFDIAPYSTYKSYFNIRSLYTPSTDSGADHPTYDPSCSASDLTCCNTNSGLAGTFVRTAFDSSYCYFNIHRLMYANYGKVFSAAAAAPDWDQILLVVNDPTYGGAGGSISIFSLASSAIEVAKHEVGHSLFNLADEYTSPYPGYPACSDVSGSVLCEANVTDVTTRAQLKWNEWVADETPVPTPPDSAYASVNGLFEGARYQSTGYYRSGMNCLMNFLGSPYCDVPTEAGILVYYRGGFGNPANGIQLIEPGSLTPSNAAPLGAAVGQTLAFSADIIVPSASESHIVTTWTVTPPSRAEQTTVRATNNFSYTFATPGTHLVTLTVVDNTPAVHSSNRAPNMSTQQQWTVAVSGEQLPPQAYVPMVSRGNAVAADAEDSADAIRAVNAQRLATASASETLYADSTYWPVWTLLLLLTLGLAGWAARARVGT